MRREDLFIGEFLAESISLNKKIHICFYNSILHVDTDINLQIWLVIKLYQRIFSLINEYLLCYSFLFYFNLESSSTAE